MSRDGLPDPTSSIETDDQKIAAAWNAAATKCPKNEQGTLLYKCDTFAKLLVKELAKRGLTGKIITLKGLFGNIDSSRWKNGKEAIADNTFHQGVEVNGKVYDNLVFDGLSKEAWRLTFLAIIAYDSVNNTTTLGPPSIVSEG